MATYKGGIPKLRFGTDLAPDQEPLGKPSFLVPLLAADPGDKREPMGVLGNESKPKRDHLATQIAKHSTDAPTVVPRSEYAPDTLAPDGRTVRLVHEDRWGNEIYVVDRTTALGEDTLPTWKEGDPAPRDWEAHDTMIAEARAIARRMLGDAVVDAHEAKKRAALTPRVEAQSPAYVCTERDFEDFERRHRVGELLVSLGWPRRLAYDGTYA